MKPPRVAIYTRVSTVDQNFDLQVHACERRARDAGWSVVERYDDHGISGSRDRRPALDRLLEEVKRRRVDIVLVWKADRMFRSMLHMVTTFELFRVVGCDFISATDAWDTSTPAGKFTFHILSAVAEFERDLNRERTRAGLAAARERGAVGGRRWSVVDLDAARAMLAGGRSKRATAAALSVSRAVLDRALKKEGATA